MKTFPAFSAVVTLVLAGLAVTPLQGVAQRLPALPASAHCRSEHDARLAFGLCADGTFDFYATSSYREDVPRPEAVLGYPVGSWHTPYGRMEDYLEALASSAPDRVRVLDYGRSEEHRTMHLVVVSAAANIDRLEAIRTELARLADPRRTTPEEAAAIAARTPVVVWLNAANDGNETAAFEAAIQLAFQLAAGEDQRTRALRGGAVVLLNLAHNPESHERHVAWYNAFVAGDANPIALEHRAPWGMSTNNNHYQIDLNRDGLGLTQTESRAVAAELQNWRPQVFVDLHGQTTQMFFPPAAEPLNPAYPSSTRRWLEIFGAANGAAFDAHGWSYYVRDVFDLYYPGYWDTYPTFHGATGMTFETDGGGSRGVRWRRDDGTILTFADGIAHHFVASLATVETAVRHAEERLRDYYDFFASGLAEARTAPVRTVVWEAGGRPDRAARLATTLLRHGIEVQRVVRDGQLSATSFETGNQAPASLPAGSYLVDLAQPNARLARTLLAPDVELPEAFADSQRSRLARNMRRAARDRERYQFYDVTAWSLPLALGVTAYWTGDAPGLAAEPLMLPEELKKAPGGWRSEGLDRAGGVTGRARSAYVWAPGRDGAYRLLARLLDEGFNIAVSGRPLVVDSRDFPRGSYIARVGRNDESLHERIDVLAREAGVEAHAGASAFQEWGVTGTGSEATRSLKAPRIAVLAGDGVSITSFGALWFILERRVGQPFTALRVSDVARSDLEAFDVVVMPDGSGYQGELGDRGAERLQAWVEGGGALVAYGGGAGWVLDSDMAPDREEEDAEPTDDTLEAIRATIDASVAAPVQGPPLTSPGARPDEPVRVPGAMLRTDLDLGHWLTYGFGGTLPVLARRLPLPVSADGANPVVYADGEALVVSGFTWPDNTARTYARRPYATVDGVGRGLVVLLAEDPVFRATFDAPAGLLLNAIYLGARGLRDGAR